MTSMLHQQIRQKIDNHGHQLSDEQIVLLGSNPLPAAVLALALRPRVTHIVCTRDVSVILERLKKMLVDEGLGVGTCTPLEDPRDAHRIAGQLRADGLHETSRTAGLLYSGGTKVMSVQLYQMWREHHPDGLASYLGPDAHLRFEAPERTISVSLRDEPRLSLDRICHLHLGRSLADGRLTYADDHKNPPLLSLARAMKEDAPTYFSGVWLELWLADLLEKAKQDPSDPTSADLFDEVHHSVKTYFRPRSGHSAAEFEADVVAVRGHTAYLFSCTGGDGSLLKSKLFEARQRADRLGGEHARAAVLSTHQQPTAVLRTLCDEGWTGHDETRSFGLPHLRDEPAPCSVQFDLSKGIFKEGPAEDLLGGIRRWVLR